MLGPIHESLSDVIERHARHRPTRAVLVSNGEEISWRQFELSTRRIAKALLDEGLEQGDRVALLMANGVAMVQAIVGALRAGIVVVPLNPTVTDDTLAAMIRDSGAKMLIATVEYCCRVNALPVPIRRVLAGGTSLNWVDFEAWQDASGEPSLPIVPSDAICNIIYSSGTTGQPKGIVHSHRARLDWAYDIAIALRIAPDARTLMTIGLYSNISWAGILSTLLVGGTLHIHQGFDAKQALATIERDRITNMALVPILCARLIENEDWARTDKSSLLGLMCCGATLPAKVKRRLMDELPAGVIELYGLTEGVATTLQPDDAEGRIASVGRPTTGSTVALLDESGSMLIEGTGEIIAQSRYMMNGYWNQLDTTAEASWIDERGLAWLRTGDIGRIDQSGFLSIVDRKKDMIISGGQNIFPADIEAILSAHPNVSDSTVIGVPDETWGEAPLALVVLREPVDPEDVRAWVNERVGRRQRLTKIEVRDTLPRNANGKVLKKSIRQPYWD